MQHQRDQASSGGAPELPAGGPGHVVQQQVADQVQQQQPVPQQQQLVAVQPPATVVANGQEPVPPKLKGLDVGDIIRFEEAYVAYVQQLDSFNTLHHISERIVPRTPLQCLTEDFKRHLKDYHLYKVSSEEKAELTEDTFEQILRTVKKEYVQVETPNIAVALKSLQWNKPKQDTIVGKCAAFTMELDRLLSSHCLENRWDTEKTAHQLFNHLVLKLP